MSAAWQPEMDHLRRRVEALENRLPLNIRVDPPGCPACDGVAGTTCRCAEPDDTPDGMLYDAWSVIANAPVRGWGFSGSANEQEQEWIDAAKRWRDAFHDLNSAPEPDPEPQSYVESLESRIKVALALCEAWDDNAADAIEAALRGESA